MSRTKIVVTQTEPVTQTCRRCGASYAFDRELRVERDAEPGEEARVGAEAEAELRRRLDQPEIAVVRCPACRTYAPGSTANRLRMVAVSLVGTAVAAGMALFLLWLADRTGRLFWVLALLAGAAAPVMLLLAVISLLTPTTHTTRLSSGLDRPSPPA